MIAVVVCLLVCLFLLLEEVVLGSIIFICLWRGGISSLYSVDKGSLAEEHGLKVGDQILDVNGHSFLSILHQEAVAIFRCYPTLIMTIKV